MEYARYGDGFVRRKDADSEWKDVALDDVPANEIEKIQAIEDRKERVVRHGYDPDEPVIPFAVITRADGTVEQG